MVLTKEDVIVGSVPAAVMLFFTIIGLHIKVPDNIAGALQHFAAGLLLSAVGTELLPVLLQAQGVKANLYATVGFFAGMAVLIILGALLPEAHSHDDDDDDDDDDGAISSSVSFRPPSNDQSLGSSLRNAIGGGGGGASLRNLAILPPPSGARPSMSKSISMSMRQTAKAINKDYIESCDKLAEAGHNHEGKPLMSSSDESAAAAGNTDIAAHVAVVEKALPMSFLAAIVVDAFMDGFLIGITGAAGPGATIIMAGSLSVEMGFVGLTLATACHGMPYVKAIPAALAGPITLVFGAILGGLVTDLVEGNHALLTGIMGFGTSALLFMVAEELLLEAHEDGGEHVWWVDVQLYTGFYWGFMSTKFLPE